MSSTQTSGDQPMVALKGARSALILLLLCYTLSITDRMILSILFPSIQAEFDLSDTQLGLLGGIAFALFYATLGVPIARKADSSSRKLIIIASLVIFSAMTALGGLATGFVTLLLFRIGVGVGEAGINPSSQSLIADYFPPHRRAFAMSILMVGATLGTIIGFAGGGYVGETYGWRAALMVVGLPGLILAVFMGLALKEPERGSFETAEEKRDPPPVLETARYMWNTPAQFHIVVGATVTGMLSYGFGQWLPTFFIRTHGVAQSEAGLLMAGLFGLIGTFGILVSGKLFDRLSKRGFQYGVWMLAGAQLIALPLGFAAFFAGSLPLAIALFVVPAFAGNFYLGPTMALLQTLAQVRMRAVTAAIMMLSLNLIGYGLGPVLVGALSDLLAPSYGDAALGLALAAFLLLTPWSVFHYYRAGRALAADQR